MKRTISFILIIVLCIISLAGCTGTQDSADSLAVSLILGSHKNFPALSANDNVLAETIYDACFNYGSVSVIVADGAPNVRGSYKIVKPDKSITDGKRRSLAKQNTAAIVAECASAKAITPEVDLLAAVKTGANDLHSAKESRKLMCIYDNGICTAGLLNLLKGDVLKSDHGAVIDQLKALHALPDLSGVKVLWIGLGCTAGEQCKVPDSYQYALKTLWKAIIEASGGSIEFDTTPVQGQEGGGLPHVSAVPFIEDSLNIEFTSPEALDNPVAFDEKTIKFIGDRADFVDKAAAMEVLKPIASILMSHPETEIIIAGTTASTGDAGDCIDLSLRRANACRDILVEFGVSEHQIRCIGLGRAENFLRVNDINPDGTLNDKLASLNRAIYIFSTDSDAADRILGRR